MASRRTYPSLKAYRRAKKLSQRAAARQFDISQAEWCRFERGTRSPKLALAMELHRRIGVPIPRLAAKSA